MESLWMLAPLYKRPEGKLPPNEFQLKVSEMVLSINYSPL